MKQHLIAARELIVPPRGHPHGPLPPMLLALTVVTGLVDAFSYLELGHVLVANMTGNVVFLGFSVADAPGFVWWALLLAVAIFLIGAMSGGRLHTRLGMHRGRHLFGAVLTQLVLITAAWVTALLIDHPYREWSLAVLIVFLAAGLGLQNATARALAVPDLTTTVLTLTLTGIAADSTAAGGSGSKLGRRLIPVTAMFLGAAIGATLVVHGHGTATLAVAVLLLAGITVFAYRAARSTQAWTSKP
ncbi:MAG: rane protein [Nocardia sp.]|uniref:YoaK family protein n=1 Tax=Nocardia sp. TaxID=1821 RepID=UPI00261FA882|nr:YoaK family protein [Nocardia sp.]MCU1643970.1 rane protein [Nocardia sp.]